MPAKSVHDTVSDTTGKRLGVYDDGATTKVYEYDNGVTLTTEKVKDSPNPTKMREVRAITTTTTPRKSSSTPWKPGQYERIFGHK